MIIPHDQLSQDALRGLIEAFITREGTDYGAVEVSHERKIEQVRRQLDQGLAVILYDTQDQSFTIVFRDTLTKEQLADGNADDQKDPYERPPGRDS